MTALIFAPAFIVFVTAYCAAALVLFPRKPKSKPAHLAERTQRPASPQPDGSIVEVYIAGPVVTVSKDGVRTTELTDAPAEALWSLVDKGQPVRLRRYDPTGLGW